MMDSGFTQGFISGQNSANNGGGGFGGWGGAWEGIWGIIILAMVFGWGGNGFGGFGGGGGAQGALTRGDLCNEFAFNDLQNGVRNVNDSVNLGFANLNSTICHQQYDSAMQNANILAAVNGGFSSLNSTICQNAYENLGQMNNLNNTIQSGFNAANVVALQGQNAIQTQLAQCCCDNKAGLAQISYDMATNACGIQNTIQNTTRDMIDVQNANTRAILDKLTSQEIAAKDAQIAAQNQKLFAAELAASQSAQNSYLINTLRPFPVAAYQVCNPFTGTYGYQGYGSGAYGNCGCGCGC